MSCLFDSLSSHLKNVTSDELRQIIVNYLETNPILISPTTKAADIVSVESQASSFSSYLENMRRNETWGGALEIRGFSELFHRKVNVYVIVNSKIIEFIPTTVQHCPINIKWNGNHFTPI
jgi:hypothetical protein